MTFSLPSLWGALPFKPTSQRSAISGQQSAVSLQFSANRLGAKMITKLLPKLTADG
jgi:hypothetical protein